MPDVHPTALIGRDCDISNGVSIGAFTIIRDGVKIAADTQIGDFCDIGYQEGGVVNPTTIGPGCNIRSHSVVYSDVVLHDRVECGHRVTIREGTEIHHAARVGTLCDLQGDQVIGPHSNLHSSVHVGKGSQIGAFVWIYPFVVLTNDPLPPSSICLGVTISDFAVLATHSTIFPGVNIGRNAVVAAASVVTRDVAAFSLVRGSPARKIRSFQDDNGGQDKADSYPWPLRYSRLLSTCNPREMMTCFSKYDDLGSNDSA